jgi:hypothetical protein
MFEIFEVGERGSMKSPKEIEQPYKHMVNSKQFSDQINMEDRVVMAT